MPEVSLAELAMKMMQIYNPSGLSMNFSSAFYTALSYDRIEMIGSVEVQPHYFNYANDSPEAEQPPVLMSP